MELKGNYDEIIQQISSEVGIDEAVADALVHVIFDNPDLADTANEEINDQFQSGSSELVFGNQKYYISVKRTILPILLLTIPTVQLILRGINLETIIMTLPTVASLAWNGEVDDRKIELDEQNGEKCILLELLKNKRDSVTAEILKKQMGNGCDKQYSCDYKKNGRCTCNEEKIEKILDTLVNRKVLKGGPAGYRYIV